MLGRSRGQPEDQAEARPEEPKESTTATIRGLNPELYNWTMARAKESGHNIGELINEAIARLKASEEPPEGVMDIAPGTGEVRLSKGILSTLDRKIRVLGIGTVCIDETVEPVDLGIIHRIEGCGTVVLPEKLYADLIGKIRGCGHIRTFSGTLGGPSAIVDPRIGGVEELVLSQVDLEQLDDGTNIHARSRLVLMDDVRLDTFQNKVAQIKGNGDTIVEVPPQLRIPALKRAHNIRKIEAIQSTDQAS